MVVTIVSVSSVSTKNSPHNLPRSVSQSSELATFTGSQTGFSNGENARENANEGTNEWLAFEAVIRPQKAEMICRQLIQQQLVANLTAQEVIGTGRRDDHLGVGRPVMLPKVLLTGFVQLAQRETCAALIVSHGRNGRSGDGKLFFYPAQCATR